MKQLNLYEREREIQPQERFQPAPYATEGTVVGIRDEAFGCYFHCGVSEKMPPIRAFYIRALRLAHKRINKGNWKKSYNWEQSLNFVKYNPLPMPKI